MALKNYYFYDEDRCDFVPAEYNSLERIVYTACVWILCGVVLGGVGISVLSSIIGTPAEIALKAENQELVQQLKKTKGSIQHMDKQISNLAHVDNEMYRSVLGMDPIPYDERKAGTGGADVYSDFDVYSEETSDILKWTAQNLENIQRSINIQKASFEEIKEYYNENQKKMKHIPAIKPVEGILLSGFGMRFHPILKYRRMHEGVDLRASIGDEVHVTGDGVVKFVGRRGTYGLLVVVDHGFGYETRYAHLSAFAKGIKAGVKVQRGKVIALSGSSGRAEGPHLHYEVIKNGQPVDPINYLFADTTPEEYSMYKKIAHTNQKSLD